MQVSGQESSSAAAAAVSQGSRHSQGHLCPGCGNGSHLCQRSSGWSHSIPGCGGPRSRGSTGNSKGSGGAAISPRMTRARKRKKLMSPGDTTVITQLDGADWSPTSSIPELQSPEAATRQDVVSEPDGVLEACLDRLHRKLHAGMYVEDCTRCQDSAI